jgi:hypothetical protein
MPRLRTARKALTESTIFAFLKCSQLSFASSQKAQLILKLLADELRCRDLLCCCPAGLTVTFSLNNLVVAEAVVLEAVCKLFLTFRPSPQRASSAISFFELFATLISVISAELVQFVVFSAFFQATAVSHPPRCALQCILVRHRLVQEVKRSASSLGCLLLQSLSRAADSAGCCAVSIPAGIQLRMLPSTPFVCPLYPGTFDRSLSTPMSTLATHIFSSVPGLCACSGIPLRATNQLVLQLTRVRPSTPAFRAAHSLRQLFLTKVFLGLPQRELSAR